jgi:serine phosphatase RsbU (regulator of sigma subunit)
LPNSQRFYAFFTDYFVIYKPKDVVSGDFYWAVEDNHQLFLAIVDCTGHGVPGAFMSMIGNTLLSDIVSQRNIHEPENILEELHNAVRIALHQEDMQNSDGMDVCLVRIKTAPDNKMNIVFAGAKRPLFYVRDGYLFEEKGFKKSIGGRQKEIERKYTQKEISLKRGDLIYLTTDGYVDQNNSARIKFGTLKFKNILRQVCRYSMKEQERILIEEMKLHQEKAEQRDDIAIIGIRL